MEKKYYTPNQEDLFVGYECQWLNGEQQWEGRVLDRYGLGIEARWFRTKYLDKQDIIDLGFTYNGTNKFYTDVEDFQFNTVDEEGAYLNYFLQFGNKEHYIQIEEMGSDSLFQGTCKSKNELKKLMKDYLNIPI